MIVCWPSPELDYINSENGDTVHCQIEYDVNHHCNSTHFALVAYSGTRTFGGGQFNLGVQVCGVLMCSCNTSLLDCCTVMPTKNNKGSEVNEMVLQGKFKSDIRVWTLLISLFVEACHQGSQNVPLFFGSFCQVVSFTQAFFSTIKPKKTQGWKKIKGIFWKTQDFANSTW